ncbi:MAG: alpha-1,4-glucan--maltose-1-phosphate maltosyltransferase [Chthoniobacterales bacterium]
MTDPDTVVIENVTPILDCGRYAVKRMVDQDLVVEADIFKDGHDIAAAVLKWRKRGETAWSETSMHSIENDRWQGVFPLLENAMYEYTIEAWGDVFATWCHEIHKKIDAGIRDLESEAREGAAMLLAAAKRIPASSSEDAKFLKSFAAKLEKGNPEEAYAIATDFDLQAIMAVWPDRALSTELRTPLNVFADRERAVFAAWYEFFPRSAEGKPDKGSTFRDCLSRIDDAKAMGFDVIYFPPIHPIGLTKRKGRNNSLTSEAGDPGVPYAIGNHRQGVNGGGHKDVAPELGTLEDFDWLVGEIRKRNMEVALDFAVNCSPDHPYVAAHPEWFFKRPDGSIKYAENPPKKYEDIYPLNFHNPEWLALWEEMKSIILFWIGHGVKIFRVDNPHTKPVAFWEWLIAGIQQQHPDVILLSEAFTRPKMMKALAKAGFTQSYTYFTWRHSKAEITEYFTELTRTEMSEYFRGNLFTNTPDILPWFLQRAGRSGFLIRAVLAATLSSVYGIYSGFELCENTAVPGREEYLDSEKYHFKGRDWNAPGNIKDYVTALNRVRRENRAFRDYVNLNFHGVNNENIIFYSRMTAAKDSMIFIIVNLDPYHPQSGWVDVPLAAIGLSEGAAYQVEDLLSGERFTWNGSRNYVALDPWQRPAHVLRIRH